MDGNSAGTPSPSESASQSPESSSKTSCSSSAGCGCHASHPASNVITISVTPTTGGQFDLQVGQADNVESLKKLISKKLKVPKERICLLHRERQLRDGTLEDNHVMEGSRLTLLPSVETGLLAQRPEQSVMQALESLNDSQVNDFLSGKAPLNLTMRLGDHMMLIQLQLSTVSPAASRSRLVTTSSSNCQMLPGLRAACGAKGRKATVIPGLVPKARATAVSTSTSSTTSSHSLSDPVPTPSVGQPMGPPAGLPPSVARSSTACSLSSTTTTSSSATPSIPLPLPSVLNLELDPLSSLLQSPASAGGSHACEALLSQLVDSAVAAGAVAAGAVAVAGATINSSSNPLAAAVFGGSPPHSPSSSASDSSRTKCVKATETSCRTIKSSEPPSKSPSTPSSPSSPSQAKSIAPTSKCILKKPSRTVSKSTSTASTSTSTTSPLSPSVNSANCKGVQTPPCLGESLGCQCDTVRCPLSQCDKQATLDTRALAEASRNLTQTLKQLSSEVLTTRAEEDTSSARRRQGAIIESMHHHGKGVYSGTFSGTLNPALQDRFGRPKRDISTVIHILNDLLCATPQYRRHARVPPQSTFVLDPVPGAPCSPTGSSTPETVDGSTNTAQSPDDPEPLSQHVLENQATRGKVERLRLVMEERRERRRARREARHSPYGPQPQRWSAKSETQPAAAAEGNEAMDTDQPLCDISTPEPVVA